MVDGQLPANGFDGAPVHRVDGVPVPIPARVQRVRGFSASWLVPASVARRLLEPSGLQPVCMWPGRAMFSLAALVYEQGDWGCYNEVAFVFPVLAPGARVSSLPLIGSSLAFRDGQAGLYLHKLPVTERFTCEAGRQVYGFPKWIGDIQISDRGHSHVCSFHSDQRHVFSLEVSARGRFAFGPGSIDAYASASGQLRRCRFSARASDVGARPGGARLLLGDHPLSEELRELGLPRRALMSTVIGEMSSEFGVPETL